MSSKLVSASPDDHPADALPVGTVLEGYRVLSVLGRGAFGITYLASEEKLERLVAIKEYLPEEFAIRDGVSTINARTGSHGEMFEYGRSSFLKEAKTLVKFKHPNIVRVLTFFEQYGTAYLVMEYEEGVDLRHYLENSGKLSQDQLLGIFIPINEGLSLVHDLGFIHRDIKPANIYIRNDGSPVLIDFGAARSVVKDNVSDLTRILTEGYAPYEQDNPAWCDQGPWTDIYALGATLYMAIIRKKPVSASARAAALMRKKDDPYESLAAMTPEGYSPEFCSAIDKALEFEPDNRPQSVREWNMLLAGEGGDETVLMPRRSSPRSDKFSSAKVHPANPSTGKKSKGNSWVVPSRGTMIVIVVALVSLVIAVAFIFRLNDPRHVITSSEGVAASEEIRSKAPPAAKGSLDALDGTVTQAMLFGRTAVVQYASSQANKKYLEEYKAAFSADNNRTAFIVALQNKIEQAEKDFEKNFSQYSIALIKLSRYSDQEVDDAVERFLSQPDYREEIPYHRLGRLVKKQVKEGVGGSAGWKGELMGLALQE